MDRNSAGSCQAEKQGFGLSGELSRGWITGWHVFKSTNLEGWWDLKRSCNGIYRLSVDSGRGDPRSLLSRLADLFETY